jgi:hypothetical protein
MKWVWLGLTVAVGFGLGWAARELWLRRRERNIEGEIEDSLLAGIEEGSDTEIVEEPSSQPERPIIIP